MSLLRSHVSPPAAEASGICGGTRGAVRVAAGLGVLGLAACIVHGTVGFGSAAAESWFTSYVYPLLFLAPAALLFLKARAHRGERATWILLGTAYVLWALAFAFSSIAAAGGTTLAIPSIADALWLGYYPLVFVALLRLARSRSIRLSRVAVLDGLIGAMAVAAVAAAVVVGPVVSAVSGAPLVVATLLAYPLGDLALTLVVLTIGAQLGWRPGRDWLVIGAALTLQVGADVVYSYRSATGSWQFGTLIDSIWVLSGLLIAWAAWHRPSAGRQASSARWHALVVTSVFTTVATTVLFLTNVHLQPVACTLAAATIMASLWRAGTTFQQTRVLGELAKSDPLTGLLNHGAFHAALESEVARQRDSSDPFSVVLLDLDGFKEINDLRGHAEGDRVLREVAEAIADVAREEDVAARVGGDEFALLLRGADGPAATAVAQRVRQTVRERGIGVDASFGVGTWPADGPSKDLLLLRADTALYAAKSAARELRAGDSSSSGTSRRREASEIEREKRDLERAQLRAYAQDVRESYVRELQRTQELKDSYLATVRTLAMAVEAKDEYTGSHIQRVHALGLLLAEALIPEQVEDPQLSYGLLLHDVGKLSVPDAVLNKPGKLDEHEWAVMKRHAEEGVRILSSIPFLDGALDVVRHHHERWDGGGYPDGLRGEEIPLWARLFAIVDTVDAMTSDRPYRRALPLEVACAELRKGAGGQFDPACVEAFLRLDPQRIETLLENRSESPPAIGEIAVPEFALRRPPG